jgi:hypothetical protein
MATLSAGQLMTTGEKRALQAGLGAAVSLSGTAPFLALLTNPASGSVDPTWTAMSSITEYGSTGYARMTYTAGAPSSASPSVISNSNTITFGPTSSSPATTIYWGMMTDVVTLGSGTPLCAFLVTTPRTPVSGDSIQAAAAAFTCQV